MRQQTIDVAKIIKPDVIFMHVQNKDAFDRKTVSALSKIGFVVNYTFDVREDISWYKTLAPHIGLTVFACHEDVQRLKDDNIHNVAYVPSSADYERYRPIPRMSRRLSSRDIVFIGNNTTGSNLDYPRARQRQEMIGHMFREFGDRFMAYGFAQKGGMINDPGEEIEIYNSAKIVICHNNFLKRGYCSDRDWRAVGCGAFTIHHYFENFSELFGASAVAWSSPTFDDLTFTCKYFLEHEEERVTFAYGERQHVLRNHTWTHRAKQIVKLIEQELENA